MAEAVISRGSTSVSVPLLGKAGNLAIGRDVGKSTLGVKDVGREDPLTQDNLNASDGFTIAGILSGPNAYADARTLAEDLIKPRLDGSTPLQLDLSALSGRGVYEIAPASQGSLTLNYVPGRGDLVGVQMTVNVVAETVGGTQTQQSPGTPDAGAGIKIEAPDGTSITFSGDETVTRKVGRPNIQLQERPDPLPTAVDKNDPASDVFEFKTTLRNGDPAADAQTLEEDIVRPRLGQDSLTLHFLDELYGLQAYEVVPEGTQALRTVRNTGTGDQVSVPKAAFRVVDNS